MKKDRIGLIISVFLLNVLLADEEERKALAKLTQKGKCVGYTIVEFGKAVNCNGDTVALRVDNGLQVLAIN